jgi:hypothetical protein
MSSSSRDSSFEAPAARSWRQIMQITGMLQDVRLLQFVGFLAPGMLGPATTRTSSIAV